MVNATRLLLLMLLTTCASVPVLAQAKNSEANQILEHAIAASGGREAWAQIKDFRASGVFSLYSSREVMDTGGATLLGSGLKRFRLTANLEHETRTWLWRDGTGVLSNGKGLGGPIGRHNLAVLEGITLPIQRIIALLDDPSGSAYLVDSLPGDSKDLYRVRLTRTAADRKDALSFGRVSFSMDVLLDRQTFAIVAIENTINPNDNTRDTFAHRVIYGSYTSISGVSIPFSVQEETSGLPTWKLEIRSFEANSGVTASEFDLN